MKQLNKIIRSIESCVLIGKEINLSAVPLFLEGVRVGSRRELHSLKISGFKVDIT
jgi:hypothetical protein